MCLSMLLDSTGPLTKLRIIKHLSGSVPQANVHLATSFAPSEVVIEVMEGLGHVQMYVPIQVTYKLGHCALPFHGLPVRLLHVGDRCCRSVLTSESSSESLSKFPTDMAVMSSAHLFRQHQM